MLLPLPRELLPGASLANPDSSKADGATAPLPTPANPGGSAPLSQLQDVLLGLILALSLLSLGCGLWLWLRFRRGAKPLGAVVLPSRIAPSASESEASSPNSSSTFSLPSPPPHAYPPSPHTHRVLVLGSPPDAGGWVIQQKPEPPDEKEEAHERGERDERAQRRASDAESEIYAVDIANGRCAWAPGVLYFAGQRLQVRPVTPPPLPAIFVTPPGRSKWSPRRE